MRPGMLLTLLSSWLVLMVMTRPLPAAKRPVPEPALLPGETITLKVEGLWSSTEQEARQSAEEKAQVALQKHFREQGLAVEHLHAIVELRPVLARRGLDLNYTSEEKTFPDGVGLMHWIVLEVPVTPEVRPFLVEHDAKLRAALVQLNAQLRGRERMIWLGKILAGLVVLLAAAAGYFRLDEWTKGYYTTWLRVGTAGFIGASILLLLLCA